MSLKTFHILFVTASTILAVGFGLWTIRDYQARGESVSLVVGLASWTSVIVLIGYGRWFLKKLKGVSWL